MSRMGMMRSMASCLMTAVLLLFAVGPASATPAKFDESGFGFEADGLGGLPVGQIDPMTPFLLAGAPGTAPVLDVELLGSQDICILAAGGNVCQTDVSGITGDFSALVTLEINVVDPATLSGPFTLFLNSLSLTSDPAYDLGNVSIELNPFAPEGLDASAVGFFEENFDGSFDPFVHVQFTTTGGSMVLADYVGWTVEDGDFVTFRYDVVGGPVGGFAPQLTANAVPIVVPEPETALLMALGLAGLSFAGGRRN
jgi:hypothetical protein